MPSPKTHKANLVSKNRIYSKKKKNITILPNANSKLISITNTILQTTKTAKKQIVGSQKSTY